MKRWQNLLHGKCPKCDAKLTGRKDKAFMYECETEGCGFIISRSSYAQIIMDENHIMRQFLTEHEKQILQEALDKLFIS